MLATFKRWVSKVRVLNRLKSVESVTATLVTTNNGIAELLNGVKACCDCGCLVAVAHVAVKLTNVGEDNHEVRCRFCFGAYERSPLARSRNKVRSREASAQGKAKLTVVPDANDGPKAG